MVAERDHFEYIKWSFKNSLIIFVLLQPSWSYLGALVHNYENMLDPKVLFFVRPVKKYYDADPCMHKL